LVIYDDSGIAFIDDFDEIHWMSINMNCTGIHHEYCVGHDPGTVDDGPVEIEPVWIMQVLRYNRNYFLDYVSDEDFDDEG